MAQPRPSLTLIVDVDERIDSEELRLEIGRSYTYVGSALVRTHAAGSDDAPVENTLRMLVKLGDKASITRISMPTAESWKQQVADGAVAAAKRAEEERAAAEAAAAAAEAERAAAEAAAEEAFLESPELVAADEEGEAVVEGGGVEAPELVFELDEPTFAVDYSTWTVEYTDGTSKTFAA